MNTGPVTQNSFLHAMLLPAVWRKAAPIGLAVGMLQAAVNQGDHWLHAEFTSVVVLKSILSPLIGLSLAVVSAAASHQGKLKKIPNS